MHHHEPPPARTPVGCEWALPPPKIDDDRQFVCTLVSCTCRKGACQSANGRHGRAGRGGYPPFRCAAQGINRYPQALPLWFRGGCGTAAQDRNLFLNEKGDEAEEAASHPALILAGQCILKGELHESSDWGRIGMDTETGDRLTSMSEHEYVLTCMV